MNVLKYVLTYKNMHKMININQFMILVTSVEGGKKGHLIWGKIFSCGENPPNPFYFIKRSKHGKIHLIDQYWEICEYWEQGQKMVNRDVAANQGIRYFCPSGTYILVGVRTVNATKNSILRREWKGYEEKEDWWEGQEVQWQRDFTATGRGNVLYHSLFLSTCLRH